LPTPLPEPSYPRASWEVVTLMEGLALMVNPTRGPALQRIADDILRRYGSPQSSGS
jgi:hypothetical protein